MEKQRIKLKRGLDLRLVGKPEQRIENGPRISSVAVIGPDYVGLKPSMSVEEGDRVRLGQPIFEDKRNPGVVVTAPAAGTVRAINRGARRALQSVVIDIDGDDAENFDHFSAAELKSADPQKLRDILIQSGQWTALRTRPFGRVPAVDAEASAIFVNAIDTNPLSADPAVVIAEEPELFTLGLQALARLTDGPVYVCTAPGASIPVPESDRFRVAEFEGPHPAGLPSTHMHYLHPVSASRINWHIGPQDVIAFGALLTTGRIRTERVIALAGSVVNKPRLLRTRMAASIDNLLSGELKDVNARAISGSVWNGRRAAGWAAYLGRYNTQVSVLPEANQRRLFGWLNPFGERFSVTRAYVSGFLPRAGDFDLNTTTNGSPRALVPIGNYEKVMPLDILATPLLRALVVRDTDVAQGLGALELIEEDVSLMSFVCVGKYDFGPHLRASLDLIEREG
ncbi:Na(+)-translocating NADH-quinone reductase subunit A [Algiphilus sp. NNCM1]|nr:Na(+)-translocating NADH-quinone reductase subunit A [Algiphilus acroporae]MCI5063575.1 Na(+)-translocating NADH-quinone reductase subunit A [Algiphilus sp.]